jgi:signal transduction histidine kinase
MTDTANATSYNVLLVEDRPSEVALTKHALSKVPGANFCVNHAADLATALAQLKRGGVDVALVDLSLPDSNGIDTFRAIRAADSNVAIVILTGLDNEELALAMLKQGAQDYLLKDEVHSKLLGRSLRFAIERHRAAALETLNEQLEKTQQSLTKTVAHLERANEDLTQFTYFFSHDLQEPLRKLNYFTKLLKEDVGPDLNQQAEQDVEFITDAARRMQGLVDSLLKLSRVGQAAMEWEPVNLEECVTEALNCLIARSDETGATIRHDALPVVAGDLALLTHLYQNLIGNALKFACDQSPLIELTAELIGTSWILGVRDNGIGIEPEFAQLIFTPFQRLHNGGKFEGSGVGLAVCKKVVERHGGRIWVESKPGLGAHFKFSLPVLPEHAGDSSIIEKLAVPVHC